MMSLTWTNRMDSILWYPNMKSLHASYSEYDCKYIYNKSYAACTFLLNVECTAIVQAIFVAVSTYQYPRYSIELGQNFVLRSTILITEGEYSGCRAYYFARSTSNAIQFVSSFIHFPTIEKHFFRTMWYHAWCWPLWLSVLFFFPFFFLVTTTDGKERNYY